MPSSMFPFLTTVTSAASDATAAGPAAQPDLLGQYYPFILIALMALLFYFFLYRPQKKQERAVNDMRNSLAVGDEIVSSGGIIGKVVQIKEEYVILETGADRTKLKLEKRSVRTVLKRAGSEEDDE